SLMHLKEDMQLPVIADTISYLCQTVAYYYDFHAKEEKSNCLKRSIYADLMKEVDLAQNTLKELIATIIDVDRTVMDKYSAFVAEADDVGEERILVDKSLIGRKELERFFNGLLAPIWAGGRWENTTPELSDEIKQKIEAELSYRLIEMQSDPNIASAERRQ